MDVFEIVLIVANVVLSVAVFVLGRGLRDSIPPTVMPVLQALVSAARELAKSTPRTDDDALVQKIVDALGLTAQAAKPEAKPADPDLTPLG